MSDILAPDDASVTVFPEDFDATGIEKILVNEAQKLVMRFLRKIDPAICAEGIRIWSVDPHDEINGWYYSIDWERLKEEAHAFCSNFACDGYYEPEDLPRIKAARDGFAELAAIFEAELLSGKPTARTLRELE